MLVSQGDVVSVREGSHRRPYFKDLTAIAEEQTVPMWLSRDLKAMSGTVMRLPERSEIDGNLTEQLIVEYYSRR
jgi:small subunit ribosomal protein S4